MSISSETKEDTTQLIQDVATGTVTFDTLVQIFTEDFKFNNKTFDEWSEEMMISLPERPDSDDLEGLLYKVALLIQKASHYLAISGAINTALVSKTELKRADLIDTLVKEFEEKGTRRPAKDIIESIASTLMHESLTAELVSKINKDFWQKKLDSFIEIRKTLEQINLTRSLRLKYEQ